MATSVTCNIVAKLSAVEVLDAADVPGATSTSDRTVTHNLCDKNTKLETSTAPDPEAVVTKAFTATATLDLTAAPKSGGSTQDLTGKKLLALILRAPTTNASAATFAKGATNGYEFNSTASYVLRPGERLLRFYESGETTDHAAVSGSAKNIDVTLSGSDDLDVTMVFGGT